MLENYRIQLIGPSGYCIDQQAARRGIAYLQQHNTVLNPQIITRRFQRFAGTDPERLEDLNQLVKQGSLPDIVLAIRGGYGASRLLPLLDYSGLKQALSIQPVVICGHSDFTAIQLALLACSGVITFSGPMLTGNFGANEPCEWSILHFSNLITQPQYQIQWQSQQACYQQWSGIIWGGNLAMICSLIGTRWMPQISNGILVIEDVGEHPYRTERMLLQLHYAGILSQQQVIIAGDFTDSTDNSYDNGFDITSVWQTVGSLSGVQVITGLKFGHQQQTITLPIGAKATLACNDRQCQLTLSGYPTLNGGKLVGNTDAYSEE